MIGEVIAIGDELTSGERLDTNSQWISRRLTELGVRVGFHTTLCDDLEACARAFQLALERADIVIASGGLGPTADDLTRDALAAAMGVQLVQDDAALAHIQALFVRRGREMPARNVVQAMFPEGSRMIHNPHGSAPGIEVHWPRAGRGPCRWYSLPGVPAELFEMWEQSVGPAVAEATGRARVIRHRSVKCFGVGESHLESMLPDIIRRGRVPSVGITVHEGTITLRITGEGRTEGECYAGMEETLQTIHQCLGSLVFGNEEDELQEAISRLLQTQQKTLATVEWGTGGWVARYLASAGKMQPWSRGGMVIASFDAAKKLLPVGADFGFGLNATSAACAEQLAQALQQQTQADLALAVSDVPPLATMGAEPAAYHVALATASGVNSRGFPYAAHPAIAQQLAAKRALNHLRLALMLPE